MKIWMHVAIVGLIGGRLAWGQAARPNFQPESGQTVVGDSLVIEWVCIKGGTFDMGDLFGEGMDNERPVHTVGVRDFCLGKTEVTVAQYRAFCHQTGRPMPMVPFWGWLDDHPMVNVSYEDAVAFCDWAGGRLPTEAEWEYAARQGGEEVRFGNGKNLADPQEINYDGGFRSVSPYSVQGVSRFQTVSVASFAPNALGLYDMAGNAAEWCADFYAKDYYQTGPSMDPQGPASGVYRSLRGGSWHGVPFDLRCTYRDRDYPKNRFENNGFRIVFPAPAS